MDNSYTKQITVKFSVILKITDLCRIPFPFDSFDKFYTNSNLYHAQSDIFMYVNVFS